MNQSTDVYNLIVDIVNNYKLVPKPNNNNQVYLMPLKLDDIMGIIKQFELTESIKLRFVRTGSFCQAKITVNEVTISVLSRSGISSLPAETKNDLIKFNSLIKSIDRDWTDVIVELQEMLIGVI